MWMPISRVAVGELAHRERVVDFGRRRIVDRKRLHRRPRQFRRVGQRAPRRERGAARERIDDEAPEVVIVRRRDRAAGMQQLHGTRSRRIARGVERLPLERVLVGPVEEHVELRGERLRQPVLRELGDPLRDVARLALLALDRRQRRLQRVRRRLAVAAAALLVEVHRRARERQRDGRRFGRRRCRAVVLARELVEAEFVVRHDFPQEIRVELRHELVRARERFGGRRRGKAQQHVRRLDLLPLARDGLDLTATRRDRRAASRP